MAHVARKLVSLMIRCDDGDSLRRYCADGGFRLWATPHYRYVKGHLCGDDGMKADYIRWHQGRGTRHLAEKCKGFDKIINSIQRKGLNKPLRLCGNTIVDGNHRAAVLLALGYEWVSCVEE